MIQKIAFLLFFCWVLQFATFGQSGVDERTFRELPPAGRHRYILDLPLEKMDSAALAALFPPLQKIARDERDAKSEFLLRYSKFRQRKALKVPADETLAELIRLQEFAKKNGLGVEQTVARIYMVFEEWDQKKTPFEQTYVQVLQCCSDMEEYGLDAFQDYRPDYLLRYMGRFFYDLEDDEQALRYLKLAERHMQLSEFNTRSNLLILNTIQTIYQKQKNYEPAIAYAQKILDFTREQPSDKPDIAELKKIWTGIATVDMASMLVEQQKFAEGEVLADRGYQMILTQTGGDALQAEYDVLQVLIPIKLGLKKLDEAQKLLRRTEELNKTLDRNPKTSPFKHIRFYQNYGRYYELRANPAEALRYFNLSKNLADSLEQKNNHRRFEKIRQRQDAERYAVQLQLVENERKFEVLLRNAALLILLLVAVLAWVNFKRLQVNRRLALAELEAARQDLAIFTRGFREKSELAERLHVELENLANRGERSQILEQLTQATILTDEDWGRFRTVFEKAHPEFISAQKNLFPGLTQAELRYLVLEKLQLTTQEMARMIGVSSGTIRQTRARLRKKTGWPSDAEKN